MPLLMPQVCPPVAGMSSSSISHTVEVAIVEAKCFGHSAMFPLLGEPFEGS